MSGKGVDPGICHEHVYPIDAINRMLRSMKSDDVGGISGVFKKVCVSCVVLKNEDGCLSKAGLSRYGDPKSPWRRYKGIVDSLVENPTWPRMQREMILNAGNLGGAVANVSRAAC